MKVYAVLCLLILAAIHVIDAKKCFLCQNVPLPRICNSLTECGAKETCYTEAVVTTGGHILYNSGCVSLQHCPNFHNAAYQIVGKRDVSRRGDISACVECCGDDFCNNKGCGTKLLPSSLVGPYCYSCDKTLDPAHCNKATQCSKNQFCSIQEHPSFKGLKDMVYMTKCMDKPTCDGLNSTAVNSRCPPVCCNTNFCNSHCGSQQPTTLPPPSTTARPYSQLIEMTCRSLLFKGYFYDSYTNLCVRVVKQSKTQAQAARACAVDGASLMIVDDSTKQDYLIYWIFSHRENDTDFWIGAKADTIKGHKFHWVDGSELSFLTYNNWGNNLMGQPDDRRVKNENCVFINYLDNYFWHDDKCTEKKTGYICEIGPLSPQQEEAECRRHVFDGYFYDHKSNLCISLRHNQQITQAAAEAACAREHAHLVTIDNADKTNFLLTWIFSNQDNQTDFWIGATDKYNNSTFYWPNGNEIQYSHWGGPVFPPELHGQPDEPRVTNQDCVYMDYIHNYFWYDDHCHNRRKGYICEIADNGHLATLCRSHFSEGYYYDFYSNMCIKLHKTAGVTQLQATASCRNETAKLVRIDSDKKTNFILSWIFSHGVNDTDFWIGAKDIHNTSTFYWPNGARLNYTHWYTIVPPPPETCVFLDHIGNYRWLTAQCDKPKSGYICEVNNHTVDTQYCNRTGGYVNLPGDSSSGLCIKVHLETKTFAAAVQTCKAEQARLVSLESEEKYENLKSYLLEEVTHPPARVWIGLLHLNSSVHHEFVWNSGNLLTYSKWFTQPAYANNCYSMQKNHDYAWVSTGCTTRQAFVCRR